MINLQATEDQISISNSQPNENTMAGAIAGTAILNDLSLSNKLKTVTLTINNTCNLSCPHCYLQYDKKNFLLKDETIEAVFKSDFEHLAIVGKEPLVNKNSISLLEQLINRCNASGITSSIITNGIGLINLEPKIAAKLSYIDVSFDGGPETYSKYRKGSFDKIIKSINYHKSNSNIIFNALHTISSNTIKNIDDMVKIKDFSNFDKIMFSPYLSTMNFGANTVSIVSMNEIFNVLSKSKLFNETSNAFLLLDTYHLQQQGISEQNIKNKIVKYNLEDKIILIEKDPLDYGIIRVTFDDYILTPYESIHPKYYHKAQLLASENNLNKAFDMIRFNNY